MHDTKLQLVKLCDLNRLASLKLCIKFPGFMILDDEVRHLFSSVLIIEKTKTPCCVMFFLSVVMNMQVVLLKLKMVKKNVQKTLKTAKKTQKRYKL